MDGCGGFALLALLFLALLKHHNYRSRFSRKHKILVAFFRS